MLRISCLVVLITSAVSNAQTFAPEVEQVGMQALLDRLGAATPTGAGVVVNQIEAPFGTDYLPTAFPGKSFIHHSPPGGVSSHADLVAGYFYFDDGAGQRTTVAPGITTIHTYEANHWAGPGQLRAGQGAANPPLASFGRIQNHSWIGNRNTEADVPILVDILRRADLVVDRDNLIMVVGVNNATPFPDILGNSYNVIAVGASFAPSSVGPTTLIQSGRSKPDIVAPASANSFNAPMVAGAAALLVETAAGNADAARAETVKVLLMTGATKAEFAAAAGGPWGAGKPSSQPLDFRFGAGELNVDNSHRILTQGQQEASTSPIDLRAASGWDFDSIASATSRQYNFVLVDPASQFTATLTWHRTINLAGSDSMQDLNLTLSDVTDPLNPVLLSQSNSTIDNVEHLFLASLGVGQYRLEVSNLSGTGTDYAAAWQSIPIPEPGLLLAIAATITWVPFRRVLFRRPSSPSSRV